MMPTVSSMTLEPRARSDWLRSAAALSEAKGCQSRSGSAWTDASEGRRRALCHDDALRFRVASKLSKHYFTERGSISAHLAAS